MASFSAYLYVADQRYGVLLATYRFTQATGGRGRAVERVRTGLVQLTLEVPTDDVLLSWAATPYKPLAGQLVFLAAQSGLALETLSWEAGQCVGYREEFVAGDQTTGAYVCHLTIAAPTLAVRAGGPAAATSPAASEPGSVAASAATLLDTALLKVEELAGGLVKKVITPTGELGTEILGVGAATLARSASLTAGLLLTPTNSPSDPGYRSEWDMNRFGQAATDQQRTRLDQLEAERAHRTLSEDEEDELATLLTVVRKVFVGGRKGLTGYYTKQAAEAHLRQLVPDFTGVHLAGPRGEAAGEFDGINMAEKIFIEDKSAQGLDRVNPKTGLKYQTPAAWAHKHVFNKTVTRIEALHNAPYTYSTPNDPPDIPTIEQISEFKRLHFRVDADTPDVRAAVEDELQNLKTQYPNWDFTAQYGN